MSGIIEVLTDDKAREPNKLDISPALGGCAIIQSLVEEELEIITGDVLRITASDGPEIFTNKIRWPKNLGPLSIVLTDRRLTKPGKLATECDELSIASPPRASKLAVVSVQADAYVVTEVVAHNLGLLLHPTREKAYCADQDCIMHRKIRRQTTTVADTSNPINFMRNILRVPAMHEVTEYSPQTDFCEDCKVVLRRQLGKISRGDY